MTDDARGTEGVGPYELQIEDAEGWKLIVGAEELTADDVRAALEDYQGMPNPIRILPVGAAPSQDREASSEAQRLLAFLHGEGTFHGLWFGEKPAVGGAFWWRKHLHLLARTPSTERERGDEREGADG